MRPLTMMTMMLAAGLALGGCSEKKEPAPTEIDPSELAAAKEKLSRIRDEVRAASEKAGEISRKARAESAGKRPAPAATGLDEQGRMRIGAGDRCPICALKPADHAKFACAIELKDGRTFHFCSAGCLIRAWLHPEAHLGVDRGQIARAVVRDYFSGEEIDALAAKWVGGSDVVGPSGPAVVPLATDADVGKFVERHGGPQRFSLDELTDERWLEIAGRPAPPKP